MALCPSIRAGLNRTARENGVNVNVGGNEQRRTIPTAVVVVYNRRTKSSFKLGRRGGEGTENPEKFIEVIRYGR